MTTDVNNTPIGLMKDLVQGRLDAIGVGFQLLIADISMLIYLPVHPNLVSKYQLSHTLHMVHVADYIGMCPG